MRVLRATFRDAAQSAGLERQQDVPLGQAAERIYCRPQAAVSLFDRVRVQPASRLPLAVYRRCLRYVYTLPMNLRW